MNELSTQDALPTPVDVCGLAVSPVTQAQLIDTMICRARARIRTCLHYLNAHTFNLSGHDQELRRVLSMSDLLYADGMSIVWASRLLGTRVPERLSAADYFETFCRRCREQNVSIYMLGGAPGVAEAAAESLCRRVDNLRIVGTHDGYFDDADSTEIVDRINARGADILVVGMGSPRQELWLDRHGHRIDVPVRWSVGALFDYFAGTEPRAPRWLCRWGGEWLYRLMVDPLRRWRRYLLGNCRFVWAVLRYRWSRSQ